jgi:hypothetical protein
MPCSRDPPFDFSKVHPNIHCLFFFGMGQSWHHGSKIHF